MNQRLENLKTYLRTGATLVDLGQLDRSERDFLRRQVKKGAVVRYTDSLTYPKPKTCYYLTLGAPL